MRLMIQWSGTLVCFDPSACKIAQGGNAPCGLVSDEVTVVSVCSAGFVVGRTCA